MTERQDPKIKERQERPRSRAGYQPEPIPWHFKLLGILFLPYLLFRLYQIAQWLLDRV
jgi:hypothetical protein